MSRHDVDRLRDALDHARHALLAWGDRDGVVLARERTVYQSILYDLIVIGSTLAKVPEPVRSLAPNIAWRAIIQTRNRFVHAYWAQDVEFVVALLAHEIPKLSRDLSILIGTFEPDEP